MPSPITEWDGPQNFAQIETIQDTTIQLLNNEVIDELADDMVADVAIGMTGRGAISTDSNTDFWILYGCQISGSNPGSRTVSEGAILYQNQVYHVSEKTVVTTGVQVVTWDIKSNSPNVHEKKELEILGGTSGSGIKDEGDPTIFRMGEWIESSTPSSGLGLVVNAGDSVAYNSALYAYKYRRTGNTLDINFYVSVNITDPSSTVTSFDVPLPNGFTKKDPSSMAFSMYGVGRYIKSGATSASVALMITNDTNSNRVRMMRFDDITGTIIMNNTGTLTLRGQITVEIE